jgi:hypothetical protein
VLAHADVVSILGLSCDPLALYGRHRGLQGCCYCAYRVCRMLGAVGVSGMHIRVSSAAMTGDTLLRYGALWKLKC